MRVYEEESQDLAVAGSGGIGEVEGAGAMLTYLCRQ